MSSPLAERPLVITSIFGTRPEAVKLLPVLRHLGQQGLVTSRVVLTGQHREMVDQILRPFAITADADLGIMQPRQSLNDIVTRAMPALDQLLERERPDMVVVQGDTTSAFCAALAAFHRRIPVAHLEAGLRTYDRFHPYPEEVNRRMISAVADLHLAPTARAAAALKAEGIPDQAVVVTGNTVIDALMLALGAPGADSTLDGLTDPLLLVTLHRREAWDSPGAAGASVLDGILEAIAAAARRHPELTIVYPVHLNPRVQEPAAERPGRPAQREAGGRRSLTWRSSG